MMTVVWAAEAVHHGHGAAQNVVSHAAAAEHAQGGLHIGVHTVWNLGPLAFHGDSLIGLWIVSAILIGLILVLRMAVNTDPTAAPKKPQVFLETVVAGIADLPRGRMGHKGDQYIPLLASFFLVILFCNWFEAFPFSAIYDVFFANWLGHLPEIGPPTADLNVTAGLAAVVFLSTHFYGFKENGLGYLQHFLKPTPVFLPLNILEELAKPFSLSIRLFGNIFGKEVIIMILVSLVSFPLLYPIPLIVLSLFIGLIQAFIFTLLATFYLEAATGGGH